MKNLRDILEIFDSHYEFYDHPLYKRRDDATNSQFKSKNGEKYDVFIENRPHDPSKALLMFDNSKREREDVTNKESHSSHKIFSTVKKILQHHLDKHPQISHVNFSSKMEEKSRVKLYHQFAKHIDPDYQHKERQHDIHFTTNVSKLREKK